MTSPKFGIQLCQGYPYIEAEVIYACREYAVTVEDFISRRCRLAFLNSELALEVIPKVADIMGEELGWTAEAKGLQIAHAEAYIGTYGGPVPDKTEAVIKKRSYGDLRDIFKMIDEDRSGYLDRSELVHAAKSLGFPMTGKEIDEAFTRMDGSGDGRVEFDEFEKWWNSEGEGGGEGLHKKLQKDLRVGGQSVDSLSKSGVLG